MRRIREVIVVEGRYDKNTLSQVVDATVIPVGGFSVFHDKELVSLLRRLAEERGLILLTDSDGAGFVIRNHLKGMLPGKGVKNAYIPDVAGKEKRKRASSKEGKLGVEGMDPCTLLTVLERAGATFEDGSGSVRSSQPITKSDLYDLGLSGGPDSAEKRRALLKRLELPERMTANAMLEALNLFYDRKSFLEIANKDDEVV